MTERRLRNRPQALRLATITAIALLLGAASYLALQAYPVGAPVLAWLGVALNFAALGFALVAGSSLANLISGRISGDGDRPGGVGFFSEQDSQRWLGPLSRTQVALLGTVGLLFVALFLSTVFPYQTMIIRWLLLGLMGGIWYRI